MILARNRIGNPFPHWSSPAPNLLTDLRACVHGLFSNGVYNNDNDKCSRHFSAYLENLPVNPPPRSRIGNKIASEWPCVQPEGVEGSQNKTEYHRENRVFCRDVQPIRKGQIQATRRFK